MPLLPDVYSRKMLKFVIDAGIGFEKEKFSHKAAYMDTLMESGIWYNLTVVWDSTIKEELPFDIYIKGVKLERNALS